MQLFIAGVVGTGEILSFFVVVVVTSDELIPVATPPIHYYWEQLQRR
jgi:hypothetical protein